jgi:hypothetical protein
MPREVIYVVVALFGAVGCLVLAVGARDEIRQRPSLRRRLALGPARLALWSMIWPSPAQGAGGSPT